MNVDLIMQLLSAAPFRPFKVRVSGLDPIDVATAESCRYCGRTKTIAVTLPGGTTEVVDLGAVAGVSIAPAT